MLPLQNTNSGGESTRITLGVLQAVQDGGVVSQRRLASNLGVALGLVNAYVKRCVKKGLLKVRQAPARRYAYYLTPAGLAEKSRLTVDYLSHSLAFFREARKGCADTLESAAQRGWRRVALIGISDIAEIAILSALETSCEVTVIVDRESAVSHFAGKPVIADLGAVADSIDGALITSIANMERLQEEAERVLGKQRVLVPVLLGSRPDPGADADG